MNRAGVPAGVVAGIQRQAERVLGHAGIQVQLRNCVPVMGLLPRSCEEPAAPAEVLLELLPGHAVPSQVLGYAQPGSYAAVFPGRAEDLARQDIATRDDILAHAVVHEAVHMVTGARQHAASGVMHAADRDAQREPHSQGRRGSSGGAGAIARRAALTLI